MDKQDVLHQLRRCTNLYTLERVVEHRRYKCTTEDINILELAADHRRAELITGKFFDRVPKMVWKLVR
jgi:hemolysin expression modulating protein